jgi:hypothetical protein
MGILSDTEGSIGYAVDSAVKADGTLGVVSIKVGNSYNAPSAAGVATVLEQSPPAPDQPPSSMATDIDRTSTAKGAYPLMLVSYLLVPARLPDVQRLRHGRHGQGLPHLRGVQRGPDGRGRLGRLGAAPRVALEQGDRAHLEDLLWELTDYRRVGRRQLSRRPTRHPRFRKEHQ